MNILRLIPVMLSCLLLSAHFLRAGLIPVVVILLIVPFLLFIKRAWVARLLQILLVLGALEWVRTLLFLVVQRRAEGEPWIRMVMILGTVVLFTGCSALLFCCSSLKARYKLNKSQV